jgi:Fe-S-cluster containining protein
MVDAVRLHVAATITYQHTLSRLARSSTPETCAALCRRVAGVLDTQAAALQRAGAGIACASGCNFCCHLPVAVFAHEAIALFRELRTTLPKDTANDIERRILDNAARIAHMTNEEHRAANLRCAFLVDGRCSAYAVRPSACATYHSMSRARCEHSYHNPREADPSGPAKPTFFAFQAFGEAQIGATGAGTAHAGLSTTQAEIHQALRTLIEDPGALERWQLGGDLVKPRQPR